MSYFLNCKNVFSEFQHRFRLTVIVFLLKFELRLFMYLYSTCSPLTSYTDLVFLTENNANDNLPP